MTSASSPGRGALPRLHVVTDDEALASPAWRDHASAVLARAGPEVALHVRAPRGDGRDVHSVAHWLTESRPDGGAHVFVNDRVDVALAVGAGGLHLRASSIPVAAARVLVGSRCWLGRSTHDQAEAAKAGGEGADYVFLGTIFESRTHPGRPGAGLGTLQRTVEGVGGIPVIGIGGIDPDGALRVVRAGAYGVAAQRGVWESRDPTAAVVAYLEAIRQGGESE